MQPGRLLIGALLLVVVLWDAFETIVFPRRVSRSFRFARSFYRATWIPWRAIGLRRRLGKPREVFLSVYGPLSLLLLLITWAALLVLAFALLQSGAGSRLRSPAGLHGFVADLYYSGTTLFTLGLGDITPASGLSRVLTVVEGATGLGFFAMVIGYLPVLSQAFSRREVNIALLDARAGSPPSAGELLTRHVHPQRSEDLARHLSEWERWCAEVLETHISFPVLAYYRSQHDNQSWVAALTTILDVSALIMAGLAQSPVVPARLTFAMARHAAVDLCIMFRRRPRESPRDRLPPAELDRLRQALRAAGLDLPEGPDVDDKLRRLRQTYEPYVNALGHFLSMPLPPWLRPEGTPDNWQAMR